MKIVEAAIISTCCFILSYTIIFVFSGLSVLYFAYDFDIKATLFFNQIIIDSSTNMTNWTKDATTSIYLAQPITCFLIGFMSLIALVVPKKKNIFVFTIIIWMIITGFSKGFSIIFNDFIFKSGLTQVMQLMGFRSIANILILFFSLYLSVKTGQFVGKVFYNNISFDLFKSKERIVLFSDLLLIPYIIGSLILLLFTNSYSFNKQFVFLLLGLCTLISILLAKPVERLNIIKLKDITFSKTFIYFILTVVLIIIFYSLLKDGISFSSNNI